MSGEAQPSAEEPVIAAAGLGRRFGRHWALAHLDLVVPRGQCLVIAGRNGSGKTTLLRLLAGLLRPSSGSLRLFGSDPAAERQVVRGRCSFISHDSTLYPRLSAREMVRVWAGLLGRSTRAAAIDEMLDRVGLREFAAARIGGFSAGMRKRLQLVRPLLEQPELVLLDEPMAALDLPGQELVAAWIGRWRAAGRTILLTSHQLERAAALADAGIVLRAGQIGWQGAAGQLAAAAAAQ